MYRSLSIHIHLLTVFCLALPLFLQGQNQQPERVAGELIVQIHPEGDVRQLIPQEGQESPFKGFRLERQLSKHANIYLFSYDPEDIDGDGLVSALRENPTVAAVQYNHQITYRLSPNDPEFMNQWTLKNEGRNGGTVGADCQATDAWELTTGGQTALGDDIVVAVIDDGVDINHEDLIDNLWKNKDEVPGNKVDDDQNGLVDDYNGWDYYFGNDSIYAGSHGTAVASIIGAKGNNSKGVSGINWEVDILPVAAEANEAAALETFDYILGFRKKYNATNGSEGSFVVAINTSWGVDYGNPDSMPIWCSMYDTLGMHGILSIGATMNINEDVDIVGDMPTACSSPYLITVTNTNRFDEKVSSAAYGKVSIDLGAPSEDTYAARPYDNYGYFGGTSGAAPLVAGAVGLIYSVSCQELMQDAQTKPDSVARAVKRFILESVDEIQTLQNKTVSGGRLNVYQAVVEAENYGNCQLASVNNNDNAGANQLGILEVFPNPASDQISIKYNNLETGNNRFILANSIGQQVLIKDDFIKRPGVHLMNMDISAMPAGFYFLYIADGVRQSPLHKLVIH